MKEIQVLRLGTTATDKATKRTGMLVNWLLNMNGEITYYLQPKQLDEEGQPVDRIIVEQSRLSFSESDLEKVEVPFEILGTQVTDKASGFSGMAVAFVYHINGCFHVIIQPSGMTAKKSQIRRCNFDLRQCEGEKIAEMNTAQLTASKVATPSPTGESFGDGILPALDRREKF